MKISKQSLVSWTQAQNLFTFSLFVSHIRCLERIIEKVC